jgi:hypothetical protein
MTDMSREDQKPSLEILMGIHGWRSRRQGDGWEIGPRTNPVCIRPGAKGAFELVVDGDALSLPDEAAVIDFLSQVALSRAREGSPPQ